MVLLNKTVKIHNVIINNRANVDDALQQRPAGAPTALMIIFKHYCAI